MYLWVKTRWYFFVSMLDSYPFSAVFSASRGSFTLPSTGTGLRLNGHSGKVSLGRHIFRSSAKGEIEASANRVSPPELY